MVSNLIKQVIPSDKYEKNINLISGMVVIIILINPLSMLVSGEGISDRILEDINKINFDVDIFEGNLRNMGLMNEEQICDELESNITDDLNKKGISVNNVTCELIRTTENTLEISRVIVNMANIIKKEEKITGDYIREYLKNRYDLLCEIEIIEE